MLVTIGSFDGFHKGHYELLNICARNSINNDWAVISFSPHPAEYLRKIKHSLFSLNERELIRQFLNVPNIFVLRFDEALKNLTPLEFWQLIREKFNVDGLVMGSDFHFGRDNSGSAETLKQLAESDGINKIFIAELLQKNIYSSSLARKKIYQGDIDGVNKILGYPFFMIGEVIAGNQRGRTMNYPTANLKIPANKIVPSYGVYSVAVLVNGKFYPGALSISNNPTFKDVSETRIEAHILDFTGNIYNQEIIIFFLDRVRDIKIFPDKDSLMTQINNDVLECRKIYDSAIKDFDTKNFLERSREIYANNKSLQPEIIDFAFAAINGSNQKGFCL